MRREGRYAEAASLVASGLALDPSSVTGHLLAAYLQSAQRTIEPRRTREFRWVLGAIPPIPRALLGLARIALEEGDVVGCRECLSSALRAYPDFPEARAVLDAITAPDARCGAHRGAAAPGAAAAARRRAPRWSSWTRRGARSSSRPAVEGAPGRVWPAWPGSPGPRCGARGLRSAPPRHPRRP